MIRQLRREVVHTRLRRFLACGIGFLNFIVFSGSLLYNVLVHSVEVAHDIWQTY
jgi:hypothetical protein